MRTILGGVMLLAGLLVVACVQPTPTPTPLPPTPTATATPSPTATPAPPAGGALVRAVPATLTLAPGELGLVQVEILLEGVGVSAAELVLSFDPKALQVVGMEPGGLLGENPVVGFREIDQDAGEARIALARVGRTLVPTRSGALVVISLRGLGATSGPRLPLRLAQATLVDEEFREISEVRLQDAEVRVVAP